MAAPARLDELRHQYAAQPRRYLAPLANALRRSGSYEEAVTMLRAQLAEYPDHLTGFVVLGQALFDTGALVESRAAFESARALDPANRVVLHHLGEIASLAGDAAGARMWFGRLRAADPYADDVAAQLGRAGAPPAPYGDELGGVVPDATDLGQEVTAQTVAAHQTAAGHAAVHEVAAGDTTELGAVPDAASQELPGVDAPSPDAFELLDFGPGDFDAGGILAEPILDPVVGLDLAPPELRPELDAVGEDDAGEPMFLPAARAARAEHDDAVDALEHITAGPFATETMAGLLAAQGHTEQAVEIYERLVAERPGDSALRARFDALRGVRDTTAAAVKTPPMAGDADRGALMAAAFADVPARVAAERARTVASAAPDAPDAPDSVRMADADLDPFADISVDRLFADAEPEAKLDAKLEVRPAVPAANDGEGSADGDDLARFDAWLRGTAADGGRVSRS